MDVWVYQRFIIKSVILNYKFINIVNILIRLIKYGNIICILLQLAIVVCWKQANKEYAK